MRPAAPLCLSLLGGDFCQPQARSRENAEENSHAAAGISLADIVGNGIYSDNFVRNAGMKQAARQRSGISDTRLGGAAALLFPAIVPDVPVFRKKSP
ncbi:hypothetical protein BUE93_01230 [Chromobacterium amazonense]|uniref:Uncharacterized protein n=1 Tax=Chromobacterium amazonense TaxID=1382803 RepID=A0A2S9XAB0_9NEIS|nr:hypothetical protein BUE93_01230 [Chromobacterium amazonense]